MHKKNLVFFSLVAKFMVEVPTTKGRLRENLIKVFNMNFRSHRNLHGK